MRIVALIFAQDLLPSEDPNKLKVYLDRLNDSADMFGMRLAPSKSVMLLQD